LNDPIRSTAPRACLIVRRLSSLALFVGCFGCADEPKAVRGGSSNAGAGGAAMPVGDWAESAGAGNGGGAPNDDDAGFADASAVDVAGAAHHAGSGGANGASGAGNLAGAATGSAGGNDRAENVVKVSFGVTRQRIDGFGVATAWGVVPPAARLDAFFSVSKGAGLSILRNRIPFRESPTNNDNFMGGGNYDFTTSGTGPDAYKTFALNWNNWDLAATRNLIGILNETPDYQVHTYFSTPWTPPNNETSRWKLGVSDYANAPEVGGYLDPAHYQDYADVLADYVLGFASKMGAPLAALSLQNEPNYQVTYESADWSAEQFHDFLTVLRDEFEKKGVFSALPGFTVLAPEAANFEEDLLLPSLADAATSSLIGIVGAHQYEFGPWNFASYMPKPLSNSIAAGKKIWVTEWNTSAFEAETPLLRALLLARLIQMDLTTANVSAYVHWWYKDLLDDEGDANKTLWAIAQFSRFVRPGSVRLEAPKSMGDDLLLSAFKNAAGTELTLVVINRAPADATFALELDAGTLGNVSSFRTSASEDLKNLGSAPSSGSFANVTAKAQSISTFVASVQR